MSASRSPLLGPVRQRPSHRRYPRYAAGLASVLTIACTDGLFEAGRVPSELQLGSTEVLATEGETIQIDVTVLDQHGQVYSVLPHFSAPFWRIADQRIARPEGDLIAAVGPGQTLATVELAGLSTPATLRINPTELRLSVDGAYLTQASQPTDGSIPLLQGRDAYLRVFLRGDVVNFFNPDVSVRLFYNGSQEQTLTITGGEDPVPTAVNEGLLEGSWNIRIPGELIRPGLAFVVEADPGGVVPAAPGSSSRFPADGQPLAVEVREVPPFHGRLVPVRQQATGRTGNVTSANVQQYLDLFLRIFPIVEYDVDVRGVYTTEARTATAAGWSTILREIDMLRVADGSERYYYGVVEREGGANISGIGYVGSLQNPALAAVGWDDLSSQATDFTNPASATYAHELGHNFGRLHAPCGGPDPGSVDRNFPYANGSIGVYGFDLRDELPRDRAVADVMSYCAPRWTSDYTYRAIMNFRQELANGPAAQSAAAREPTLLVWGSVRDGEVLLEPAFEIETRPQLPRSPGPNVLEGFDDDGAPIFRLTFAALDIAHSDDAAQHFVFALPLDMVQPHRLSELRLTAPGEAASLRASAGPRSLARQRVERAAIAADRAGASAVALSWNTTEHPGVLVRDPRTGQIVGFSRTGAATLQTDATELEVHLSDGLRSGMRRVQVGRP